MPEKTEHRYAYIYKPLANSNFISRKTLQPQARLAMYM